MSNIDSVIELEVGEIDLGSKTITESGTYYAKDDGYDGYSEVTVNAPVEWRNFTYTYVGEIQYRDGVLPTYDDTLGFINVHMTEYINDFEETIPAPTDYQCKLPIVNGKCEFSFVCGCVATLDESSTGCTLTEGELYTEWEAYYKVEITEDNAKLVINLEI